MGKKEVITHRALAHVEMEAPIQHGERWKRLQMIAQSRKKMEPERYGSTYPGHKFPMRDSFLAAGLIYLCNVYVMQLNPLHKQPLPCNFLWTKTTCCSNLAVLLSSQDIVQLYVHFLECTEFAVLG